MPDTPAVSFDHVRKVYPGTTSPAVTALSFDVAEGETVALIGPSGCGKTTALKMINRLIEPTSGTITVLGEDVAEADVVALRRGIGYVIQQVGLLPHRTVAQNVATVPVLLGWDEAKIDNRVDELFDLVQLDPDLRDRYPSDLSGGQRQRVGVARALAADPPIMLMDEPFGAVDPIVRKALQEQFLDVQKRLGKTILFVTHDIDEAITLADRVAVLNIGGHLEQLDTPMSILKDPANDFVVSFLGHDRGLKRLSLIPISSVDLVEGPAVSRTASIDEARHTMERWGVDWIALADGDHLHGWAPAEELDDVEELSALSLRRFESWLTIDASLLEALDVVVSSRTSVAAVFDGDRYLGMLSAKTIGREIVS